MTHALAFPILYLFFMVPFWIGAIQKIAILLKMMSSILAFNVMRALGYQVLQDGVTLHFTNGSLEVADPCSGIRSLMALLSLGTVIAYYSKTNFAKKIAIILLAIPLSLFGNTIRVVIFAFVLETKGYVIGEGPLHSTLGMAVFILSIIVIFFISRWMQND
jgi:exosortase